MFAFHVVCPRTSSHLATTFVFQVLCLRTSSRLVTTFMFLVILCLRTPSHLITTFVFAVVTARLRFAGHHPVREQRRLPPSLRLDGSPEDLAAEADAGRDNQDDVREAPDHPGHAGADGKSEGLAALLPPGVQCERVGEGWRVKG